MTSTLKRECPVYIKFKLINEALEVIELFTHQHSHIVSPEVAAFYPEIRRLTQIEENAVTEMVKSGAPARVIATSINAARQVKGTIGTLVTKDVFNKSTSIRTEKRDGKTEEEILKDVLGSRMTNDPNGTYELGIADDPQKTLTIIYVQTAKMKETFQRNNQVLFLDSTYRINIEQFCLYAVVVMDENGFGQPAALGFMANEQAATLRMFFDMFKERNPTWNEVSAVFVDRDFTQIAVLEEAIPQASVLICAFHDMKTLKLHISRERIHIQVTTEELRFQLPSCSV